eukprot:Hpha_TRINITY_DN13760_c0_g2::TRINITY_DN13760_c0_g2_i1::g.142714::m.142714
MAPQGNALRQRRSAQVAVIFANIAEVNRGHIDSSHHSTTNPSSPRCGAVGIEFVREMESIHSVTTVVSKLAVLQDDDVWTITLILANRMCKRGGVRCTPLTVHHIIVVCFFIALKLTEDIKVDIFSITTLAKVGRNELFRLERVALELLDWSVYIEPDEFNSVSVFVPNMVRLAEEDRLGEMITPHQRVAGLIPTLHGCHVPRGNLRVAEPPVVSPHLSSIAVAPDSPLASPWYASSPFSSPPDEFNDAFASMCPPEPSLLSDDPATTEDASLYAMESPPNTTPYAPLPPHDIGRTYSPSPIPSTPTTLAVPQGGIAIPLQGFTARATTDTDRHRWPLPPRDPPTSFGHPRVGGTWRGAARISPGRRNRHSASGMSSVLCLPESLNTAAKGGAGLPPPAP